jgi:tetratricopeptide (TPR) repeat protein
MLSFIAKTVVTVMLMKRIYALFLFAGIASSTLWSQEDVPHQLNQSVLLEQQGQFDKAIKSLQPLIDSNALSRADLGRAWTLIGFAYKEQGQFQRAQDAYERALRIFEGDKEHTADYANTLEYLARLYQAMRQEQMAMKLGLKAIEIYAQRNDHCALARIYTNLAGAAIQEHRMKDAHGYLEKAKKESRLTNGLTDDDNAALSSTQAWFASSNGKTAEAISANRQALELWRHGHGEQHHFTGWGYVLLGQALTAGGQLQTGLMNLQQGLTILRQTVGPQNPKYLVGEILYAKALEQSGMHTESTRIRNEAEQALGNILNRQCMNCTVSVATLLQK